MHMFCIHVYILMFIKHRFLFVCLHIFINVSVVTFMIALCCSDDEQRAKDSGEFLSCHDLSLSVWLTVGLGYLASTFQQSIVSCSLD